jgi:hypothetical protein
MRISAPNELAMTCGGPPAADLYVTSEVSRRPAGKVHRRVGRPYARGFA